MAYLMTLPFKKPMNSSRDSTASIAAHGCNVIVL